MTDQLLATVTEIHDKGQTLRVPRGKVVGIADTRAVFDEVAQALQAEGFQKIEALSGQEGVNLLERIHRFFFSDMEDRMLANHIGELKTDHIIMLIDTPTDRVDEAVSIASQRGAHCLVHYGRATVTWLTK
ncbi:MAG TPA: hypothetical protein VKD71_02485 [Gemmataceae bacterium]|nr:hypothetical protein [Gemmataceae bacterium]